MQKKDKEKVFGGDWTDAQLRDFLTADHSDGSDPDYAAAIRAYRHMVPATFAQFVELFNAEGHNLNAQGTSGETIVETLSKHAQGAEYVELLKQAGAA